MRATLHASSSAAASAASPSTSSAKASVRSSARLPARSARAARPLCPSASFRAIAEPPAVPFPKSADHLATWSPDSWRKRPAYQQPNYPDAEQVELAAAEIARLPPLVFAGECRTLQARLAKCASGEAFLLQGEIVVFFLVVEAARGVRRTNEWLAAVSLPLKRSIGFGLSLSLFLWSSVPDCTSSLVKMVLCVLLH